MSDLKIDPAVMVDGLRRLASHLHNLDSGSGEAKLLWGAADEIERQQRVIADYETLPDRLAAGRELLASLAQE